MPSVLRWRVVLLIVLLFAVLILLFWLYEHRGPPSQAQMPQNAPAATATPGKTAASSPATTSAQAPTLVFAHNLILRKGPSFRVYVRWLNGQMTRAHRNENPSFDDPDSFFLDIKTGVLRANIGDINTYLNAGGLANTPLKNIALSGDGEQVKLRATVHKVIPLPIEVTATISALPDNRIQLHVTKIDILKIPFKALLGGFHVTVQDLFNAKGVTGLEVKGNDILFDTQTLLPPPHIRGQLSKVRIANPDLEEIYGDAREDVERVEQWRNFLRLRDGTIDFGKLTMHHVDLIMIDISKDPWFDLDLTNYQTQLVNGYTRMTPQAGLQIFMPDLRDLPPQKANKNISIEWLKNRNVPPPDDIKTNIKTK